MAATRLMHSVHEELGSLVLSGFFDFCVLIRKYSINPGTVEAFLRRVHEGFVPLIREVPGFQASSVLEVRNDEVVSISIFDMQAGAEEAVRRAADWVAKHFVSFLQAFPEITVGQVRVSQLKREQAEARKETPAEHLSAAQFV